MKGSKNKMFIRLTDLESEKEILLNIDHIVKIRLEESKNKAIITDIRGNTIIALYTKKLDKFIKFLEYIE